MPTVSRDARAPTRGPRRPRPIAPPSAPAPPNSLTPPNPLTPPIQSLPPDPNALFRDLVALLALAPASGKFEDGDVLLDVVANGRRFQLLRTTSLPPSDFGGLSPREREIARLIAKGHPNKVIASILEISVWTVGTYVRRLFAKLDVASRAAMIARLHELHALRETLGA